MCLVKLVLYNVLNPQIGHTHCLSELNGMDWGNSCQFGPVEKITPLQKHTDLVVLTSAWH